MVTLQGLTVGKILMFIRTLVSLKLTISFLKGFTRSFTWVVPKPEAATEGNLKKVFLKLQNSQESTCY